MNFKVDLTKINKDKHGYYSTVDVWLNISGGDKDILTHAEVLTRMREQGAWKFGKRKNYKRNGKTIKGYEFLPLNEDTPVKVNIIKTLTLDSSVKEYIKSLAYDYDTYCYWCFNLGKEPIVKDEFMNNAKRFIK